MNQNEPKQTGNVVRRLSVPLSKNESENLKKLAEAEDTSEGRTAKRLIREGLKKAEEEGRI